YEDTSSSNLTPPTRPVFNPLIEVRHASAATVDMQAEFCGAASDGTGWKNLAGIVGLVSLHPSYVRNERRSKWNMKSCPAKNGSSGEFCCSSMKKPSLSIVILCLPSACACHGFASRKNISSMLRTES